MDLCVDCNLLFAELEEHGFCLGFSTVVWGVMDKCQVDYWHRGDFVCCIKSKWMIATSVFFIIGNELRDDFPTYSSIIKFLNAADHLEQLMKVFAPILLGDLVLRKQLFDYLYTLEDDGNSINIQQHGLPDNTDSLLQK